MSDKKEKSTIVTVQGMPFDLKGMKGFKKSDFLNMAKSNKEKSKGKGKWGRFDAEKAWEQLEKAAKK